MANANGSFGLKPISKLGGNVNSTGNSGYTMYEIKSDNSNVIYQGSPVIPLATGFIDIVGAAAGGLIGGIGSLIKAKNQQENPKQNTYTTNIDPMTGQEKPLNMKEENKDMPMMMGPLKQLSPYTASYSAYNMSAKQASMEPKMQMLSGAATLMTAAQENAFGPDSELAKTDPARAKKIYEGIDKND